MVAAVTIIFSTIIQSPDDNRLTSFVKAPPKVTYGKSVERFDNMQHPRCSCHFALRHLARQARLTTRPSKMRKPTRCSGKSIRGPFAIHTAIAGMGRDLGNVCLRSCRSCKSTKNALKRTSEWDYRGNLPRRASFWTSATTRSNRVGRTSFIPSNARDIQLGKTKSSRPRYSIKPKATPERS